jgi:hypothetical protein
VLAQELVRLTKKESPLGLPLEGYVSTHYRVRGVHRVVLVEVVAVAVVAVADLVQQQPVVLGSPQGVGVGWQILPGPVRAQENRTY